MDLSTLFGGLPDNWGNIASAINGGSNVINGLMGVGTANNVNNQVQSSLGQNTTALQQQIDALNNQINTNRQQAQDQYNNGLTSVNNSNAQLQGTIGTQTANLNALSDPNSPYMQEARQAIERKDAAAGRNSQWGDRETQLAGTLAQYVSQYSPGITQSINQAQNQISQNNQGLASLYQNANQPGNAATLAQIQALQQQIASANAANTTGRQSATAATNSIFGSNGVIQGATKAIGGLAGLFGGSSSTPGATGIFQGSQTPTFGSDWTNPASVLTNGDPSYNFQTGLMPSYNPNIGSGYSAGANPFGYSSSMNGDGTFDDYP